MKRFFANLIDFLYPKPDEVYSLESLSAAELVLKLPPAADLGEDVVAIWSYTDPRVRELVWELKYRKNSEISLHVAQVLYDVLRQELAERALFDNFVSPLLVPIPQSHKRGLEKGFNQTEVICACLDSLARREELPLFEYTPDVLHKERHTSSQTLTKNRRERIVNVENSMHALVPIAVEGRNVILFDDVTTTGATFKEARRALKSAGAKKILCIALAH